MSLSDELLKLEALLHNGSLTQDEFQLAKQRVLEQTEHPDTSNAFEVIRAQNEVAQLDREWGLERENYMITGKYGRRYLPSKVGSTITGLFVVGFGTFWTIMASSMPQMGRNGIASMFPLFGVLFILFGVAISAYSFFKAGQYESAHQRYLSRRRRLSDQHSDQQWNT